MSVKKKSESSLRCRNLVGHQPARIVLVDMSSPFEKEAGKSLCDVMEDVLCLSARMEGFSRIPLISIYLLTSIPELVLPLACTKGNFVRLHDAFTVMRTFLDESLANHQSKGYGSCLLEGITEACNQFKRYVGSLPQAPSNFKELEIIVLSGHPGHVVQKDIYALTDQIDLNVIKRVVYATVKYSLTMNDVSVSPEEPTFHAVSDDFRVPVDFMVLECDPYSLQQFFYGWMSDSASDCEHVHLILPPPIPGDPDLVIMCDLNDVLLNPSQLPFHEAYNLHAESVTSKHIFPPQSKAIGMTVPVQLLKAVGCLQRGRLDDSTLFGLPLTAAPTSCWKMDWDVLDMNENHFISLCSELLKKDQVLITHMVNKLTNTSKATEWPSHRASTAAAVQPPPPKPAGFFVVIPSEQKSMLIKSIACSELLLPSRPTISFKPPSEESRLCIQSSLAMVATLEMYNPLNYRSGLFSALKHNSLPRSAVDKARANKRKIDLLQNRSDSWGQSTTSSAAPIRGGRLTANPWSNPITDYLKVSKQASAGPSKTNKH
ncbi:unnamed protein product [Lymnaea stagnalis]|uniref:Uncharacterized protein n=1 Tax=Lymnaea stagnalis TaxID=6523 RepID=A0AAV2HTC0_LYMST